MNAQLKQRKKAEKTGKMAWLDGISLVEGLVQEQQRNIERAVIDEGPYQLCREFENLKVDPDDWLELSESEKSRRLFKLHGIKVLPSGAVNRDVPRTSNETSDINITELATRQLPKTVGLKPGSASARKRSRQKQALKTRDASEYTQRASGSGKFHLYWIILHQKYQIKCDNQASSDDRQTK